MEASDLKKIFECEYEVQLPSRIDFPNYSWERQWFSAYKIESISTYGRDLIVKLMLLGGDDYILVPIDQIRRIG